MDKDQAKAFVDSVFDFAAKVAGGNLVAKSAIAGVKALVDVEFDVIWQLFVSKQNPPVA